MDQEKQAYEKGKLEGKNEELERQNKELFELLKTQLFHASSERLTRGSIGAGSTVIYGSRFAANIGIIVGVIGVVFGTGCLVTGVAVPLSSIISYAIAVGGFVGAFLERKERKREKK